MPTAGSIQPVMPRHSEEPLRTSRPGSITFNGPDPNSTASKVRGMFAALIPWRRPPQSPSHSKKPVKHIPAHIAFSRWIVENKYFISFTMVLTLYALCGSDIKLITTDKPMDGVFDGLTLFCIFVFTAEIILSVLGKDDYFLGFFFILDVISTVTLLLDLTWINDLILGDEEDIKNVRGSRTAKIGARATRLVRVIRLVRIIKLYKAVYDARQAKKRREARGQNPGDDDDDWEDEDINLQRNQLNRESRVGKKLSEMTIRRVILLVLTMMMFHKLLRLDQSHQFPTSAQYGADMVNDKYRRANSSDVDRLKYEKTFLTYVFYHNWYAAAFGCRELLSSCPADYDSALYWIGIVSDSESEVIEKASLAQVRSSEATAWVDDHADDKWRFTYDTRSMPPHVVSDVVGGAWRERCDTKSQKTHRLGLSLIGEVSEEWKVSYAAKCPEDLRRVERRKYFPTLEVDEETFNTWHIAFYFDVRQFVFWESIYSLVLTAFICLLLCVVSLWFTHDANRLVLHPVENMIAKVETIRDNPLSAMKVADEEFKVEEMNRAKARKTARIANTQTGAILRLIKERIFCIRTAKSEGAPELMETVILEKTIIKLGSLLALGFGQAGATIIGHNMHGVDSACVDAMIEGTRVDCIIGTTRIRDFSIATEVLQSRVMTFVNQIAEIVHGVADEFHGYASKNNGDFFLMIWRKTATMDDAMVSKLADMSILAFTRILGAVHRSPVLAAYRGHPGLQQRLGKNCRVNLSSGLHYGWAIEGAVGTEFKIDASYLSPNVSIAESVERATQIYGVSVLVAQSVVRICTPSVAAKCRLVDRVIMTGSAQPLELYVIDLDYMSLTVELPPPTQIKWTSRQRFRVRQFLEAEKAGKWHETNLMVAYFNENHEIASMRFRYTIEFHHVFNMGYQNYSQGEWQVARRLLDRTRNMLGVVDGPSLALLRFMETPYQFKAPDKWDGVRDLGLAHLN